jgi:hypothetical protein
MIKPFSGPGYTPALDDRRLTAQIEIIRAVMLRARANNSWLSLREIEGITGYTTASISAQLRNLKKSPYLLELHKQRRWGDPRLGLWEYQIRERKDT